MRLLKLSIITICALCTLIIPGALYAQSCDTAPTANCQEEDFVGSGGSVDSNSSNYSGRDAAGDSAVGESESNAYQLRSGYVTDGEPRLQFIVNTSSISLGDLTTAQAVTANSTFSVLNYTSFGYVVQAFGDPPANGSYVLDGMSSTAASQTGTEQYGINLRANTSPVTFGADAVQVPDSSFSSGGAAGGYSTANNFRYVPGETVASAAASSGQTNYTVSYIVNISSTTPAGKYSGQQGFICVGTY